MKPLPLEFEPNASFCYKFARYHLLPELAQEPEALTGEPFKLNPVITRVMSRYLTEDQLNLSYPARDTEGKMHQVGAADSFFCFHCEQNEVMSHPLCGWGSPTAIERLRRQGTQG